MNKKHITITIIVMLLAAVALTAPSTFGVFEPTQPETYSGGLQDFYACTHGNVTSACNVLYSQTAVRHTTFQGGLQDFYACTHGNVTSACNALNGYSATQPESYSGGLQDFYACTRGKLAFACAALHIKPYIS
jgi:hypothetical protein